MVAMSIMFTVFVTTMSLFYVALRSTFRSQNIMISSADASIAATKIITSAREGQAAYLPTDSNFVAPSGAASDYQSTDGSGNNVCTGIEIVYPVRAVDSTIMSNSGVASPQVYTYTRNSSSPGNIVYFYRSNSDGTPNDTSGAYLWMKGTDQYGNSVNRAIVRTVATDVANAVQFEALTSQSTVREIAFKVACRFISGATQNTTNVSTTTDTNESNNGNTTSTITGQCVMVRNQAGTPPTTSSGHWSAIAN
jgi:hypothetical protein